MFQVLRLDPYAGSNGIAVMIAQATCCLFLLYFLYREVKKLKVEKKKYFTVILLHFLLLSKISLLTGSGFLELDGNGSYRA